MNWTIHECRVNFRPKRTPRTKMALNREASTTMAHLRIDCMYCFICVEIVVCADENVVDHLLDLSSSSDGGNKPFWQINK